MYITDARIENHCHEHDPRADYSAAGLPTTIRAGSPVGRPKDTPSPPMLLDAIVSLVPSRGNSCEGSAPPPRPSFAIQSNLIFSASAIESGSPAIRKGSMALEAALVPLVSRASWSSSIYGTPALPA